MEPHSKQQASNVTQSTKPVCECCQDAATHERRMPRREFLANGAGVVLGASAIGSMLPAGRVWAQAKAESKAAATSSPESLVKVLYDMLSPKQRESICFPWDHQDKERGLLRTHISANWDITDYFVNDDAFYNKDQQAVIRKIFEGIIHPDWHKRIDEQLEDDAGGYGEQNSVAIFGEPGSKQFSFVMTGRHMTIRCDGNSAEHVAFGGPIFYGHAADGNFNEAANHPNNVFWPQAQAANNLYKMLDGKQQSQALLKEGLPREQRVGFRGKEGPFQGLAVAEMSSDQKDHLQAVVGMLMGHYRRSDQDEFTQCLKTQGGLDACHLAYYAQNDIGNDGVWDIWRLEGPSFVWHYRGAPHVHVWVNMADDPNVKLNA